ncbi:DEKNAAC100700 [Brettanomyces naardenensis]|uniref:DEKNAAC100700 n=1 Tax=Brettanomyces naardenensis TaxID=13370 RepID=A0A448YF91_BRENA|nr:DEKNAAC100700 [Brettanomyces naardenensis]
MSSRESDFADQFMESFSADEGDPLQKEKVAWQQQAAVGDYNRKVLDDLLEDNRTRPVKVTHVNVFGTGDNFRDSFLQKQLKPLLSNNDYLTLEDFLRNVDLTTTNFTKAGAIRNIGLTLTSPRIKSPYTSADTLELVANLNVLPVKKFFMKVGTNVGNGEGDGYLTLQWKNIFGGGELLNFDTNLSSNRIGTKSKSQYLVSFGTPVNNDPNFKFDAIAYHSSRLIDYTSYQEQAATGLTNRFSTNYLPSEKKFNHELSFENLVRSMSMAHSPNNYRGNTLINDYFLLNAGHSLKSSLAYSLRYDSRNSPILPRQGHYIKLSSEVSLMPGSRFLKNTLEATSAHPLTDAAFLNLNVKSGLITKYGADAVNPMDKFQFGGPNDMRGFLLSGMGPKQMGMSTGGDAFFGAGLSLFSKLPFVAKDSDLKMQFFGNVGKLINVTKKTNVLHDLTSEVDMSVGVGIVYAHPAARFELNYTLPIVAHSGEDLRRGLQWGIGLSFL